MMDLYEKYIYDIQRYIQWPEINLEDEHLVPNSFFWKLEDNYETVKVQVRAKEVISKEVIQELLAQAIDGVFSLYDFRAQICDKHGRIQKVLSSP